jgi:hypothetical protein
MKHALKLLALFMGISLVTFFACKKEEADTVISEEDRTNTSDYAKAETIYAEIWYTTLEQARSNPALNGYTGSSSDDRSICPTITVSPQGSYPKTLTLDYGTGCTTPKGQTLSGKIVAVFSGPINQTGVTIAISFVNFNYKGYTISGTYAVTTTGAGVYSGTISNGSIQTPSSGGTITYSGSFVVTQVEGANTTGLNQQSDDVYNITLDVAGIDTGGKAYTAKTTSPLRKELDCEWIVSGSIEVKSGNTPKKTLDFGAGTCDNMATLKVGQLTTPITLP